MTATTKTTPGRTGEHRAALRQLRTLAGPHRFRVKADAEGWPIIPGRLGQIGTHNGATLAVYTDRPKMIRKILAIPGVRRHQIGDREARALFPAEVLEQVAA